MLLDAMREACTPQRKWPKDGRPSPGSRKPVTGTPSANTNSESCIPLRQAMPFFLVLCEA
jgi:hypothetical protein